jgi:hypothetical protein
MNQYMNPNAQITILLSDYDLKARSQAERDVYSRALNNILDMVMTSTSDIDSKVRARVREALREGANLYADPLLP